MEQEVICREIGNDSYMAQQLLHLICCSFQYGAEQHCSKNFILFLVFEESDKLMNPLSAINSASNIKMDYMKLLVTQLQNQNPLEPLDNNEMASQLALFSQLEQLESMNTNFAKVLDTVERTYANSLIGRDIDFIGETETGTKDIMSGVVEQVYNNVDGEIFLVVGKHVIGLEDVASVKN